MAIKSIVKKFITYDILEQMIKGYKNIPSLHKNTFWIVFISLNIAFAFHTINFFWGSNEWGIIKTSISPTEFWNKGQFTLTIPYILMGSRILPVLINLFGFFGLSLSVISLAIYWKIPKKLSIYTCFCLAVALMPYNFIWLANTTQTSLFWGTFIIISALQIFENKFGKKMFIAWNILSIFLLFFVFGMSISFINTILICITGRYFIEYLGVKRFTPLLKRLYFLSFDIIISLLIFKACLLLIPQENLLSIHQLSLTDIPLNTGKILPVILEQFTITYPFLDGFYLGLLMLMTGLALITTLHISICKKGLIKGTLSTFIMLFCLLLASQFINIITQHTDPFLFDITGYFGHYYIYALMFALICHFSRNTLLKNILFAFSFFLILIDIQRIAYAMRVWYQGREAENKIIERVIDRIESDKDFSYKRKYHIVLLGDFSLRKRFYDLPYLHEEDSLLDMSWRAPSATTDFFNFWAPKDFVKVHSTLNKNVYLRKELFSKINLKTLLFIKEKGQPWPHKDSVFIYDDFIFVILEQRALDKFKNEINKYL